MLLIPVLMLFVVSELVNRECVNPNVPQFEESDIDPSYFKNPPCPNAEDIAPCTCSLVQDKLEMECKGISDEQQLHDIFHSRFPVKLFDKLTLETYLFDTLSDDVFGEVKFKSVFTPNYGMGRLKSVGRNTFKKMASELTMLSLGYSNFSTFPFEILQSYPKLWAFSLRESPLLNFPIIQSESLKDLDLSHGMYEAIPSGAFDGMPNLEQLVISSYMASDYDRSKYESFEAYIGNKTLSIPKGVFASLLKLQEIQIVNSQGLKHTSSLQFEVNSAEFKKLDLRGNGIETIEVDAFKGIPRGSKIDLSSNSLWDLPEATWMPILNANIEVDVEGNWIRCTCEMSGLERHLLIGFQCNGKSYSDWYHGRRSNCY